jgi:poly(A)-specific ribonuclease
MFSKYLYKRSAHEAGYDSMLTAITFLKMATHIEEGGKLPKGMRGQLEDISLGLAIASTNPVHDLFPSKGFVVRRGPFQDFFDIVVEEEEPQAEEPVVQTSVRALADTRSEEVNEKVQKKLLIPRLGSDFWHTYGNRLRVFAAFEKIAYLGPTEEPVDVTKTAHSGVNGKADDENKVVQATGQLICFD